MTVVFSASGGVSFDRSMGQLRNFGVALVAMWIVANIPPQQLMRLAIPIYVAGLGLLIGVALFGEIRNGARRWLNLGFITLQPSEIMKIGVPLLLAWFFHRREEGLSIKDYAVAGLMLMIPVGLVMRQPDLGTSIMIFSSGFFVIFLAGLSWKIILGAAIAGAASLPFAWNLLHDYQRQRVLTLLDPMQDPLGAGYHIIQSTIAIGSGGILGKGWLNGSQRSSISFPSARPILSLPCSAKSSACSATCCCSRLPHRHRPRPDDRVKCADDFLAALGRRCHADVFHLRLRQYRHGLRHPAGGGRAAAVDQLWRHGDFVAAGRNRDIDVDFHAQAVGVDVNGSPFGLKKGST